MYARAYSICFAQLTMSLTMILVLVSSSIGIPFERQDLSKLCHVMDKSDEGCWPIYRSKGHHSVGPLNGIDPLKSKFFTTCKRTGQLMKTHWQNKHPHPNSNAKLVVNRGITSRDGVRDYFSGAIQGNVVNAELPDKILNIMDCFLMGLWGK